MGCKATQWQDLIRFYRRTAVARSDDGQIGILGSTRHAFSMSSRDSGCKVLVSVVISKAVTDPLSFLTDE